MVSLKAYLAEKRWDLIVGTFTSAVGLLVALFINRMVDEHHETEIVGGMAAAIRAEAASNKIVLHESFERYYRDGVVLRPFEDQAISRALVDPLFIKHSSARTRTALAKYSRAIRLANAYRAEEASIRITNPQSAILPSLIEQMSYGLDECANQIKMAAVLPENF